MPPLKTILSQRMLFVTTSILILWILGIFQINPDLLWYLPALMDFEFNCREKCSLERSNAFLGRPVPPHTFHNFVGWHNFLHGRTTVLTNIHNWQTLDWEKKDASKCQWSTPSNAFVLPFFVFWTIDTGLAETFIPVPRLIRVITDRTSSPSQPWAAFCFRPHYMRSSWHVCTAKHGSTCSHYKILVKNWRNIN